MLGDKDGAEVVGSIGSTKEGSLEGAADKTVGANDGPADSDNGADDSNTGDIDGLTDGVKRNGVGANVPDIGQTVFKGACISIFYCRPKIIYNYISWNLKRDEGKRQSFR